MRELQLAELSMVTGGQSTTPAPTNPGTNTTTTTDSTVNGNTNGSTGTLTFGPGGQPTGGSISYTWGSTRTTTTTTTTVVVRPNDETTPKEPLPRTEQQSEVPSDLDGLY
jgi:hypothetical protein